MLNRTLALETLCKYTFSSFGMGGGEGGWESSIPRSQDSRAHRILGFYLLNLVFSGCKIGEP